MVGFATDRNARPRTVNVAATTEDAVTNIYTCPSNCRALIPLLYVTNVSGGTCTVNIEFDRADGSHMHILGSKNMANGEFIQWTGSYIVLESGDELNVTPSSQATPHIDVMVTVEEFFKFNSV